MEREFTSLAEGFSAAVNSTNEGLLVCMCVLVFSEVLGERKHFRTKVTLESLLFAMDIVVTL